MPTRPVIIPARPRFIYHLMLHVPTGERYTFRLDRGRVAGVLGPRNLQEWRATDLESLDYDANTERAEWAARHLKEFDLTG